MFLAKVIWGLMPPDAVRAGMNGVSYRPLKDGDLNGLIMLPWRFWKSLDWQGSPLK